VWLNNRNRVAVESEPVILHTANNRSPMPPGIFIGKFQGPGKSYNFPGSDADGSFLASNRHVSADENSHDSCCHQVRFLGCRYDKHAFVATTPP